jgi:beta-lactamase regulating signal transducer with metallopeptidase domain
MISYLPTQSSLVLEAALRSLLLALAVWIVLRVFRVHNVLAQKAAWGVVLAAALAMPVVLPMAAHWSVLPANVRVVIPADPQSLLEELQARIKAAPAPELKPSAAPDEVTPVSQHTAEAPVPDAPASEASGTPGAAVEPQSDRANPARYIDLPAAPLAAAVPQSVPVMEHAESQRRDLASMLTNLLMLYFAVTAVLLLRIAFGLAAAIRLLRTACPVPVDSQISFAASRELVLGGRIRCSKKVASPVTIFSSIVLPADYATWGSEKLRIVLAHELSHIRQRDFYLQLLAGVYAAVVWFSPLGWWLKRKLSDLAEAISDHAGLEEAADCTSYAQVLLQFAAAPRPTVIGVAMARSGSLSRRIERLLNDTSFRQAFAGSRRTLATVLIIPITLFAATTLVRVEAAGQAPAVPIAPAAPDTAGVVAPQAPASPAVPESGVSEPEQVTAPSAEPVLAPTPPVDEAAPQTAPELPSQAVAPQAVLVAPAAPAAPAHMTIAPLAPPPGHFVMIAPKVSTLSRVLILAPPAPGSHGPGMTILTPRASVSEGYGIGTGQSTTTESGSSSHSDNGKHSGYHYSYSSNGQSYAVIRGNDKEHMTFSGDWIEGRRDQIDQARKQAHGDFLWFTRDGKSYFVDDPTTLAQIETMYKPMEDLGKRQEELGKQQEVLGKQQEELGQQQEAASVPTPDMSKQIAEIDEAMAKLKANQGKNMTQDQFGEIQEKLAELQSRLGEMQGQIGSRQGEFGARMGELGAKMGALGSQQGRIGEEQGRIAGEADRKVKSIIDESLKNGKAHPVQ